MPANGAIYIQKDTINLFDVFDKVKTGKSQDGKTSYYEVMLGDDAVQFNIMPPSEVVSHITGFLGYINSWAQDKKRKTETSSVISHTKIVLGLSTDREFEDNHEIWNSLFKIAEQYDGLVFVRGSVLLSNGAVLIGPLLNAKT